MNILGIETSCDETAAAVVADGTRILSSVVASQMDVHRPYGGVVPELASRKHIEAIVPVVEDAIFRSRISHEQLQGVAVTQGPGLVGALLIGFSFAKAYCHVLGIPYVGVNHLEGHILSVFLTPNPPPFPFIALLVSGGHTAIYHVNSFTEMERLGQTRDDAAGEAFDKVSKMLGLGYPGGPIISKIATTGDPKKILFPRSYLDKSTYDFSFSGLKTAVNRYIRTHEGSLEDHIPDIAAGFQDAVVDVLSFKVIQAAMEKACRHIALVGGVAANPKLREIIRQKASENDRIVHIPPVELCGDNAAMIAAAGYHHMQTERPYSTVSDVFSRCA